MEEQDNNIKNIVRCVLINVMKNFIFCRHIIQKLWLLFLDAKKRYGSIYADEKNNKMRT